MKFPEGQYNKALLLTFDDKSEVVAKLPNPNAGPAILTTASEVATMEFACRFIGIPIPRVLNWSCDPLNPVGSEYIIMEKARGTLLSSCWYEFPSSTKYNLITQVVELESKLTSFPFPVHGCIYHKQDLPSQYSDAQVSFAGDDLQEFCIGPVVDSLFWPDSRSELQLSRGPWRDLSDYATSLADKEKRWINRYAQPRINYYRSYTDRETPSEYIDLVEKYLQVATSITQSHPETPDILQSMLWHSDLHLSNIHGPVDLAGQDTANGSPCEPGTSGWIMPEKPADYNNLLEDAKLQVDALYKSALCHKYYEVITAKRNPRNYAALTHNDGWKPPHIRPNKAIGGAWADKEILRLRESLIDLVDNWAAIQSQNECPVQFTPEERALHREEIENREYVEHMMEGFQAAVLLLSDGVVEPEDYETIQRTNDTLKAQFLSLAENEEERAWMDKVWPYQDPPQDS